MTSTIIGRIPTDYNDRFGDYTPTKKDLELLDEEISKRLPDNVFLCGDELIAEMKPGESSENTKNRFDMEMII